MDIVTGFFVVSLIGTVCWIGSLMQKLGETGTTSVQHTSAAPSVGPMHSGQVPTEIDQVDFLRALKHFLQVHEFQIKPSAPKILNENWWQLVEENQQNFSAVIVLKYREPAAITHTVTSFELRLRLQLFDNSTLHDFNLLQYDWLINAIDALVECSSPTAHEIVDYTVTELRLELLAQARARNPNLGAATALAGSFVKKHNYNAPTPSAVPKAYVAPIVEKAYWPSPQDYNEAIQNPKVSFDTPVLQSGKPELTPLGLPRVASGAFASVYKLHCQSDYAIKCFLTLVHDQKDRYEMISKFILNDDLDYTVDFDFIASGILVRGKKYPILRMDWVSGEPLNFYVERNLNNPAAIRSLADNFVQMMVSLRHNGIAHGDLQHGNILVTEQGIRLVDYDGMFVPGMEGMVSNELGHRNYQHPKRHPTHFGPWLDNFSAWVIYISLRVLAIHPEIWTIGAAGDEALLFRQADFTAPDHSALIKELVTHTDEFVKRATEALVLTLQAEPDQVPYLDPA